MVASQMVMMLLRFNTVLEQSSHSVSPQAPCLKFNGDNENDFEG